MSIKLPKRVAGRSGTAGLTAGTGSLRAAVGSFPAALPARRAAFSLAHETSRAPFKSPWPKTGVSTNENTTEKVKKYKNNFFIPNIIDN